MKERFISEKRLTSRLTKYWENLKQSQKLPSIEQFNIAAIDDIAMFCMRLAVNTNLDRRSYVYEFVGEEVQNVIGFKTTNSSIEKSSVGQFEKLIVKNLGDCLDEKQPVYREGKFVNEKSKVIKYRCCILPFAREDQPISHLVVGFSYKIFG